MREHLDTVLYFTGAVIIAIGLGMILPATGLIFFGIAVMAVAVVMGYIQAKVKK